MLNIEWNIIFLKKKNIKKKILFLKKKFFFFKKIKLNKFNNKLNDFTQFNYFFFSKKYYYFYKHKKYMYKKYNFFFNNILNRINILIKLFFLWRLKKANKQYLISNFINLKKKNLVKIYQKLLLALKTKKNIYILLC